MKRSDRIEVLKQALTLLNSHFQTIEILSAQIPDLYHSPLRSVRKHDAVTLLERLFAVELNDQRLEEKEERNLDTFAAIARSIKTQAEDLEMALMRKATAS